MEEIFSKIQLNLECFYTNLLFFENVSKYFANISEAFKYLFMEDSTVIFQN